MLRQIVALWKGESFMKKVVGEFGEMLSDTVPVYPRLGGPDRRGSH